MKTKLFSFVFLFSSLLLTSCSTDDVQTTDAANSNVKIKLDKDLKALISNTEYIKTTDTISKAAAVQTDLYEGDPSNPKPPRKD